MKPARLAIVDRDIKPANVPGVVIVRRVAEPARRARLVRLLRILLDSPDAPDESP